MDLIELEKKGPESPTVAEGLPGLLAFLTDLCHVQTARAADDQHSAAIRTYSRFVAEQIGSGRGS